MNTSKPLPSPSSPRSPPACMLYARETVGNQSNQKVCGNVESAKIKWDQATTFLVMLIVSNLDFHNYVFFGFSELYAFETLSHSHSEYDGSIICNNILYSWIRSNLIIKSLNGTYSPFNYIKKLSFYPGYIFLSQHFRGGVLWRPVVIFYL